jgi:hypothetical protein
MTVTPEGIGTTNFFFVAKDQTPQPALTHGEFYFTLKVFAGNINYPRNVGWWSNITSVALVTSTSVTGGDSPNLTAQNLNHAYRKSGGQPDRTSTSHRHTRTQANKSP